MGYLDKLSLKRDGVLPNLVRTAEYGLASYGFGYVQNRFRERASVMGVPLDLLVGVAGKAASIFGGEVYGMAPGLMPHIDNVANAGIGAYFHTLGAGHGARAAGVKRLLIRESDVPKARKALPDATILGDLPRAPRGDFLSPAELMEMAK